MEVNSSLSWLSDVETNAEVPRGQPSFLIKGLLNASLYAERSPDNLLRKTETV